MLNLNRRTFLAGCAAIAIGAPVVAPKPIVYLTIGQSNMYGSGGDALETDRNAMRAAIIQLWEDKTVILQYDY